MNTCQIGQVFFVCAAWVQAIVSYALTLREIVGTQCIHGKCRYESTMNVVFSVMRKNTNLMVRIYHFNVVIC